MTPTRERSERLWSFTSHFKMATKAFTPCSALGVLGLDGEKAVGQELRAADRDALAFVDPVEDLDPTARAAPGTHRTQPRLIVGAARLQDEDRGHTAVSQLKPGDIDWNTLFAVEGARWFHCGGIFAALGERTPEVAIEAMECAKENGTIISYDLNYRSSLWKSFGGTERAMEVNRRIAELVDVMIGNEEDFTAALGFEVEGVDENLAKLDPANFQNMIEKVVAEFPNFKVVATTLRGVKTAGINDWGAVIWADGEFHEATLRPDLEIYDRVGGGDSFASGVAYGFLAGKTAAEAVEYGAAHGALAMTTPGDTTRASLAEVEKLVGGGSARVDR